MTLDTSQSISVCVMTDATAFLSEYQFSLIDLQAYREERRKQLMRRYPRRPVNTRAIARAGIASKAVTISDISNGGLCISGAEGLFPGMEVTVSLVTGLSRVGTVRWWLAGNCGLQFEKPLAPDDEFLADVVKRSKPLVKARDDISRLGVRPRPERDREKEQDHAPLSA